MKRKLSAIRVVCFPAFSILAFLVILNAGCKKTAAPATSESQKSKEESAKKTGLYGLKGQKKKTGLYGLKGPKNANPELAKQIAEAAARNAKVKGLLKKKGSPSEESLIDSFAEYVFSKLGMLRGGYSYLKAKRRITWTGFGHPRRDRQPYLWRIEIVESKIGRHESDIGDHKGTIRSNWFVETKEIPQSDFVGPQANGVPAEFASHGLGPECHAIWNKKTNEWFWVQELAPAGQPSNSQDKGTTVKKLNAMLKKLCLAAKDNDHAFIKDHVALPLPYMEMAD